MAVDAVGVERTSASPLFSESYKRGVLAVLVLAYTCNFIDRTIIATIGQAIKVDLKLTDTELGLLGGLAFAIFYTLLGIPIARLAERWNRVTIIAVSTAVWSAFTAACGFAANFSQLMLMRVGVGVGEAGLSPPAHSLISDYYEPRRRASALSIYALGIPLGTMFGAVAGGWIADNLSWRFAFVLVGLPGLLIALLVRMYVQEPPRGYSEPTAPAAQEKPPSLFSVVRLLFGNWGLVHLIAGATLVSLAGYGTNAYSAAYLIRSFGVSYTLVGLVFGIIGGLTAAIGTLLGGWLSDLSGKHDPRWYALVPGIGVTIAFPFYVLIFLQDTWEMAAYLLLIPGIFHFTYVGPTFGLIQNSVEARMRATAAAVMLFIINIVGLGLGPPLCGWLIDTFSAAFFDTAAFGDFLTQCPGGVGREGGGAALDTACKAAVVQGTRWGILVTLGFFAWGAVHYFAAAWTLPKTLLERIRAGYQTA